VDKAKMENKVRETFWENGGKILTGEGHQISIPSGVCSDHASKAPGDCCRKTARKAAQENSQEDGKAS
jgi:hypothetical protein|tara:strand:+ start:811 stop:1014 length:204 start_codon:yes stop_codon:yes gene_type:complete